MLFTELRFVLFFAVAFAIHWALRKDGYRKGWLLLCSYAFYGAWDWRFCSLILFSTIVDYWTGKNLGKATPWGGRKLWVSISLVTNLGLLGFFKYFDFFVESGQGLFDFFGLEFPVRTIGVILPVGISFYTFQTLSYTIDIYRGTLKPVDKFLDFALFVGFFPQLVAGPIVRAIDFLPQLKESRVFRSVNVRACLTLFLIGYFKKAVVSDNLAPIVDVYFQNPDNYSVWGAFTAVYYSGCILYCDFSGYSDMACATAGLLGYRLCSNFNFPYFASNVNDFWNRWHISFSSWMRDYVYISLGGNRGTKFFAYRNLTISLVLCGLWHGAGTNFIIFGIFHAVGVLVWLEWKVYVSKESLMGKLSHLLGPIITFHYICGSMIIFRPSGYEPTMKAIQGYFFFTSEGSNPLHASIFWAFPILAAVHYISYRGWLVKPWKSAPAWLCYGLLGVGYALALQFAAKQYAPFIYFQF
jgi:alginate O-acetyltransferase complex protein AlgI